MALFSSAEANASVHFGKFVGSETKENTLSYGAEMDMCYTSKPRGSTDSISEY